VRLELTQAAVSVHVLVGSLVDRAVPDLGGVGRRRRRGDVRDGREVVPVEAVPDPEDERGRQEADRAFDGQRGKERGGQHGW
jgi:hypothetical protein